MKIARFLAPMLIALPAGAGTLHELVVERVKPASVSPAIVGERTSTAAGLNPIQYFEYRYGRGDEQNKRYHRVPFSDDGGEQHTVRIHLKSVTELMHFEDSRRLSGQLLDAERRETLNQKQYDAYTDLVQQVLHSRMLKILGQREAELQRAVNHSSESLGLPKADVRDLVQELAKLQRVDADHTGARAANEGLPKLTDVDAEALSQTMIDNVAALAKRLDQAWNKGELLRDERKRAEFRLKKIDREISWAKDRKIIDHIDLQRDTLEREDSFRIGFNIPFLRFDNEDRARDKALLLAAEHEAARETAEIKSDLRRRQAEVYSLAGQVESTRTRLKSTRDLSGKARRVSDVEFRSMLAEFTFELERDALLQALKFYNAYLEYMRDTGAFARNSGVDLLDPQWKAL